MAADGWRLPLRQGAHPHRRQGARRRVVIPVCVRRGQHGQPGRTAAPGPVLLYPGCARHTGDGHDRDRSSFRRQRARTDGYLARGTSLPWDRGDPPLGYPRRHGHSVLPARHVDHQFGGHRCQRRWTHVWCRHSSHQYLYRWRRRSLHNAAQPGTNRSYRCRESHCLWHPQHCHDHRLQRGRALFGERIISWQQCRSMGGGWRCEDR